LISLAAHMLKVEAGRRRTTQAGQPQRLCSGLFLRATCQQKAIGHPEKKVAAGGLWTGTAKKRAASEQGRQAKHATKAFRNLRRLRVLTRPRGRRENASGSKAGPGDGVQTAGGPRCDKSTTSEGWRAPTAVLARGHGAPSMHRPAPALCRFMIAALRTSDRPRHSLSATAARDSGKMPTRGVQHTLPCRKLCRLMALSSKT
ncbi:unnamed protein product, partial [Prorocentrum cordatum]